MGAFRQGSGATRLWPVGVVTCGNGLHREIQSPQEVEYISPLDNFCLCPHGYNYCLYLNFEASSMASWSLRARIRLSRL